jgi:hypothetical protein
MASSADGSENLEAYSKLLGEAGGLDAAWLCSYSAEEAGVCPHCGQAAVASGEAILLDWEGTGAMSVRYANYCGCGQSWVEEATGTYWLTGI